MQNHKHRNTIGEGTILLWSLSSSFRHLYIFDAPVDARRFTLQVKEVAMEEGETAHFECRVEHKMDPRLRVVVQHREISAERPPIPHGLRARIRLAVRLSGRQRRVPLPGDQQVRLVSDASFHQYRPARNHLRFPIDKRNAERGEDPRDGGGLAESVGRAGRQRGETKGSP